MPKPRKCPKALVFSQKERVAGGGWWPCFCSLASTTKQRSNSKTRDASKKIEGTTAPGLNAVTPKSDRTPPAE